MGNKGARCETVVPERSQYLAHTAGPTGKQDTVRSHLLQVARRASAYAATFAASQEAFLTGLLHDLGKYGGLFQKRLEGKERGIDHWSAGAWLALSHYRAKGIAAALAIQGHHIGLQQASADSLRALDPSRLVLKHPLGLRLSESDVNQLFACLQKDSLKLPDEMEVPGSVYEGFSAPAASAMLDVRMLFSTLVDADFIETEAHFKDGAQGGSGYRATGRVLDPERALRILLGHLEQMSRFSRASKHVNLLRVDLLSACLDAAEMPRGIFTLTAPTGTGKTLSSLAFALKHAVMHKLRRVIVVVPYLTIIEQTVRAYRQVFDPHMGEEGAGEYVLEHHSLAGTHSTDGERATEQDSEDSVHRTIRLLSENWDAPVVVTTSVQFLESLFSNRPSTCRKLHRLAQSVILMDEVQSMPVHLAIPTLATLSRLARRYNSTIVFSTATQPAFERLSPWVCQYSGSEWLPSEIVPSQLDLFARAARTEVKWPSLDRTISWTELSNEMVKDHQALCVVNLKRHALTLHGELHASASDGLFHLSTNMCPAHRSSVLDQVRQRLEEGDVCRLISTQCVEAGVDLDFPVVYRAFAPLEAIAQAGGRCNRNGRISTGTVHVFIPEDEAYPDGTYRQAACVTRLLLKQYGMLNLNDPSVYRDYYREFYDIGKPENRREELLEAIKTHHFVRTAQEYRIIERNAINVLVAYDREKFRQLAEEVREMGLNRAWIARARPHAIGLFRPKEDHPVWRWLEPALLVRRKPSEEWYIYLNEDHYDADRGLVPPEALDCLIA